MFRLPFYFVLARTVLQALTPFVKATPWALDDGVHEAVLGLLGDAEFAGSLEGLFKKGEG
jgi:hypothetical protein